MTCLAEFGRIVSAIRVSDLAGDDQNLDPKTYLERNFDKAQTEDERTQILDVVRIIDVAEIAMTGDIETIRNRHIKPLLSAAPKIISSLDLVNIPFVLKEKAFLDLAKGIQSAFEDSGLNAELKRAAISSPRLP